MDRRAIFFLVAALVSGLLSIPTDSELRWVPELMTVSYTVLAGLSLLDYRVRRSDRPATGADRGDDDQPNRPVT